MYLRLISDSRHRGASRRSLAPVGSDGPVLHSLRDIGPRNAIYHLSEKWMIRMENILKCSDKRLNNFSPLDRGKLFPSRTLLVIVPVNPETD
jgi:hypothetical protein